MKKFFMNNSLNLIKKNNPNLDEIKLEEIEYGLESIYLTYTKIFVIFILAIILNIFKECLLLLITYNIIRTYAFGLHATKSIYCLITSLLLFIGGVYICKYINIPYIIKIITSILCVICLIKYAPADTEKRPLINKRKRKKFKIISSILGTIYLVLIIILNNHPITNYLLIGLIEAVIMIHPFVYKVFNLPYDNYKRYNLSKI